jgi:hypothetical protein
MITGTVYLDASRDSEPSDRRLAGELYRVPEGARVVLFVGDRRTTSNYLVQHVRTHVAELDFDFRGSVPAVQEWVNAARGDDGILRLVEGWSA